MVNLVEDHLRKKLLALVLVEMIFVLIVVFSNATLDHVHLVKLLPHQDHVHVGRKPSPQDAPIRNLFSRVAKDVVNPVSVSATVVKTPAMLVLVIHVKFQLKPLVSARKTQRWLFVEACL